MEHPNQSQPNPGLRPDGSPCSYDFMDEPLLERNGRHPQLKSALRQPAAATADGSASSSAHAHVPPNTCPRTPQPGGDATTDGEEADLIFDYVEGDKRRERRRLNSARAKNRLLRKHCSSKKDSSVCSADDVTLEVYRDIKRGRPSSTTYLSRATQYLAQSVPTFWKSVK